MIFYEKKNNSVFYAVTVSNEIFLYLIPDYIPGKLRSEGHDISVRLNDVKINMKTLVKGFTI